MGCAHKRSTGEEILSEFWQSLPIRKKTPLQYVRHYLYLKNDEKINFNDEKDFVPWVVNGILLSETDAYKKQSINLFLEARKYWTPSPNEGLKYTYWIALLFLTDSCNEKSEDILVAFEKLFNEYNLRWIEKEEDVHVISKENLIYIIKAYLHLITLLSGFHLIERKTFEDTLAKAYSEKIQNIWIDRFLSGYSSRNIPLLKFLNNEFKKLHKDSQIRDDLYCIWSDEVEKEKNK